MRVLIGSLLGAWLGWAANAAHYTNVLSALDAERIAREGKTDREFYAVHPEYRGDHGHQALR